MYSNKIHSALANLQCALLLRTVTAKHSQHVRMMLKKKPIFDVNKDTLTHALQCLSAVTIRSFSINSSSVLDSVPQFLSFLCHYNKKP